MQNFKVDLKTLYPVKGGELTAYVVDTYTRPALIVVPGGGYGFVSPREGEPVALEFLQRGYNCFVLDYTIGGPNGASYPEQFLQLAAAIDYVKKNAETLRVVANEVYAVGASAGGHLVGTVAVNWQNASAIMGKEVDCKLTAVGLMYPVISQIDGHQGSYTNLLYGYSDEEKEKLMPLLNLNEAVTPIAPPAFLFTTATDTVVPPSNAIRYALACGQNNVPYELHVYPIGRHGLSTGKAEVNGGENVYPNVKNWLDDCHLFFSFCAQQQKA